MKRLARSCLHRSIRNVLQRFQSSSSLHRSSQKLLLHNKMFAVTQWPSTRALTDSDREVVYKHLGSFQGEKKRILSDWAKTNTTSGDQPHKDMQSWFKDIFGQTVDTEFVAKLLRDLIDNHLPLKFEVPLCSSSYIIPRKFLNVKIRSTDTLSSRSLASGCPSMKSQSLMTCSRS